MTKGDVATALRAGSLAAGIAMLCAIFAHGVEHSGWIGHGDIIGLSVLFGAVVGTLIAIPLGWPEPRRSLAVRALVTPLMCLLIGGLALGAALLSRMREANMPYLFAPLGLALVAIGLRRLPENRPLRIGLISVAAILFAIRALQLHPPTFHAIERRLIPMSDARVRGMWDGQWCGARCRVAKVIAFNPNVTYINDDGLLYADVFPKASMETTVEHLVDGCGDVREKKPEIPEWATKYKTTAECFAANKMQHQPFSLWTPPPTYHECCYLELRTRKPGERFEATGGGRFVLFNRQWQPD
jgi:hypothetical protein